MVKKIGIVVSIIVLLFGIFNIIVSRYLYNSCAEVERVNMTAMNDIAIINENIINIDRSILALMTETDEVSRSLLISEISDYRAKCESAMEDYTKLNVTDLEKNRYNQCRINILTFNKKVDALLEKLQVNSIDNAKAIYNQEFLASKNCTLELLEACSEMSQKTAVAQVQNNEKVAKNTTLVLIIVTIIFIVVIEVASIQYSKSLEKIAETTTKVKQKDTALKYMGYNDVLTGVGNRVQMYTDIKNSKEKRTNNKTYIIMANMINFAGVNNIYGADVGDRLLVCIAERLQQMYSGVGKVYRTGSDEFTILFTEKVDEPIYELKKYLMTLKQKMEDSYIVNNIEFDCKFNIGVGIKQNAGHITEELFNIANLALKQSRINSQVAQTPYGDINLVYLEDKNRIQHLV